MKKNRKLLHLIKDLDIGGIQKTTIQYSKSLINDFDLIGIYANRGFYDTSVYLTNRLIRFFPPIKSSNKILSFIIFFHILFIVKKHKITHLHYHHRIYIPHVVLLKILMPNLKLFYTHHSCFNDKLNSFIIADKIIALNNSTYNDIPPKLHSKVTIIPHGIPIQSIALKNTKPKKIGFVGRYVKLKGIYYLLDEFKQIKSSIYDVELYFYGKGPEEKKMKEFVKNNSLTKSIYFLKPEIELSKIYKNIDLLVLPSTKIEGFGLVILEAFSFGVPVAVKDLSIYDKLVIDNYNGIVYNDNLSENIITLFNTPTLFNKMRKNAKENLDHKFHLENTILKYLKLYQIGI